MEKIGKYTIKDIEEITNNIVVLVDTRENANKHIISFFDQNNIKYESKKLDFGDYSFKVIPNKIITKIANFENILCIERKNSLSEICLNFTKKREQFINEFERAKKKNAKMNLMIEDENGFENIIEGRYISKMNRNSLRGSLMSFIDRYNCCLNFVNKEYAPIFIYDTFYYRLKNILKNK